MKGAATILATLGALGLLAATAGAPGPGRAPLGDGPREFTTYEQGGTRVRLSVVTRDLRNPWSIVWLSNGDMLITERSGQLRRVSGGQLEPEPLIGLGGLPIDKLFDIALHPQFADNGFVYLTYIKRAPHPDGSDAYWATRTGPRAATRSISSSAAATAAGRS